MPKTVNNSLKKGKQLDKENNYKLNYVIYNCINIENNITEINKINQKIENYILMKNIEIKFSPPNENYLFGILKKIKNFGKIYYNDFKYSFIKYEKSKFRKCGPIISEKPNISVPGLDIKGPKIAPPYLDMNGPKIGQPNINGPKIGLPGPDINGPKIGPPNINGPKIGLPGPDINAPKIGPPNINGPKIGLPGPDINAPKIGPPKINGPKIGLPVHDINAPKIGPPNINGPKIGLPVPDINAPKICGGIEINYPINYNELNIIQPITVINNPNIKMNINQNREYEISGHKDNILTKKGIENNWMGVICQNELEQSKENIWKIKILKTQYKCIMVGVAPFDFDINSSIYNYGWYLYCYDSSLYSGEPHNYLHKETNLKKVNNEIKIVMNMKEKTLKFIIDDEDKGESFSNIPTEKPLAPVVLMYNNNDSIEILEYNEKN